MPFSAEQIRATVQATGRASRQGSRLRVLTRAPMAAAVSSMPFLALGFAMFESLAVYAAGAASKLLAGH